MVGKVGITVSPANPERVWAIVEAEDGGVFRSDNGGQTWTKVNEQRALRQRAVLHAYLCRSEERRFGLCFERCFFKSNDGGRTYTRSVPHGDNHDLWIAPDDPNRMIRATTAARMFLTTAGEAGPNRIKPTAQFYRVALDNDFPYNVYGAQQDNSTMRIASRTMGNSIGSDWHDVGGGESGWIAPSPKDSNIVYAGSYGGLTTRYDHRTGQERNITPYPNNPMGAGADVLKYRFQWNFPIVFSPHDPNTLYAAANVLFKSTDEGSSWQIISPDLTRNDKTNRAHRVVQLPKTTPASNTTRRSSRSWNRRFRPGRSGPEAMMG